MGKSLDSETVTRRLTIRQQEVAALIARRYVQKEIAAQLGISEKRVQRHVQAIKQRFGVNTLREIADLFRPGEFALRGDFPPAPNTQLAQEGSPWPNPALDEPLVLSEREQKAMNFMPSLSPEAPRIVPRLLDGKYRVPARLVVILLGVLGCLFAVILAVAAIQGVTELVGGSSPDLVLKDR